MRLLLATHTISCGLTYIKKLPKVAGISFWYFPWSTASWIFLYALCKPINPQLSPFPVFCKSRFFQISMWCTPQYDTRSLKMHHLVLEPATNSAHFTVNNCLKAQVRLKGQKKYQISPCYLLNLQKTQQETKLIPNASHTWSHCFWKPDSPQVNRSWSSEEMLFYHWVVFALANEIPIHTLTQKKEQPSQTPINFKQKITKQKLEKKT